MWLNIAAKLVPGMIKTGMSIAGTNLAAILNHIMFSYNFADCIFLESLFALFGVCLAHKESSIWKLASP